MRGRVLAVLCLCALAAMPAAAVVADEGSDAGELVASVNQSRSDHGLPALAVNGALRDIAQGHSDDMADQQRIWHTPDLANRLPEDWNSYGENVGRVTPPSSSILHAAFMAS